MRLDRLNRISDHGSVFLVGPNGAGKSRTLRALCDRKVRKDPRYTISVSNTPYARLPQYDRKNYAHLTINTSTTSSLSRHGTGFCRISRANRNL